MPRCFSQLLDKSNNIYIINYSVCTYHGWISSNMLRFSLTISCLSGNSFLLTPHVEFRLISSSLFMPSFIQQSLIQKLTEWQTENTRLTKELCNDLLTKLKRQHLDPILRQLQGHGGSNLSFDDIIGVYHRIKDDYEGQAVGAKDVIAATFFDFQPVSISSRLNVLHAAFVLVVACSGVRLALWLFLVLFYFVSYCFCYCCVSFCLFHFSSS